MAAPSSSPSTTQRTSKNAAKKPTQLPVTSHQPSTSAVDADPGDQHQQTESFGQLELPRRTPCSQCTNISIMHLFHEMKQEFPTVPDEIVCSYVMNNCHNRSACIENLKREAEHQPQGQVYPSQALRHTKRPTPPRREGVPPPIPPTKPAFMKSPHSGSTHSILSGSTNSSRSSSIADGTSQAEELARMAAKLHINTRKPDNGKEDCSSVPTTADVSGSAAVVHEKLLRPTTLNFRPTRQAPPPPSTPSVGHGSTTSSNESLNVSLNVTVSPVSGRPPMRPPRLTSALSMNPETSYLSPAAANAQRSFTSVNFTLRKPAGAVAASPIEISAGPGLTYSSSSYDARQGYQSRLEITVGGSGQNTISASRMRPPNSFNNIPSAVNEEDELDILPNTNIRAGVSMPNFTQIDFQNSHPLPTQDDEALQMVPQQQKYPDVISRQLLCKESLANELDSTRRQRDVMEREIRALQAPIPTGGISQLREEVERLRWNCDRMANEILEEGTSITLGEINEAFYQNIYTGQRLPIQSTRPPRPPRPPPPMRATPQIPLSHSASIAAAVQHEWTCNMCTFRNHPLLNKCEQCEMPRLSTGTQEMQRQRSAPARLIARQPSLAQSTPSPVQCHIPLTTFDHFTRNISYDPNLTQQQTTGAAAPTPPAALQMITSDGPPLSYANFSGQSSV